MADFNVWTAVRSLQELKMYSCPECHFRSKMEHDFKIHALNYHEESVILFENPIENEMYITYQSNDKENWDLEKLKNTKKYCCPECSFKSYIEYDFIIHAIISHPESVAMFETIPNLFDTSDIDVNDKFIKKEEVDFEVNSLDFELKIEKDVIKARNSKDPKDGLRKSKRIGNSLKNLDQFKNSTINMAEMFCEKEDIDFEGNLDLAMNSKEVLKSRECKKSNVILKDDTLKVQSIYKVTEVDVKDVAINPRDYEDCDFVVESNDDFEVFFEKIKIPEKVSPIPKPKPQSKKFRMSQKTNCYYCNKQFHWRKVHKHAKKEHKNAMGRFPCPSCDKTFESYHVARLHATNVHVDKTDRKYKCDLCPFASWSVPYMLSHRACMHVNKEKPKCKGCDQSFPTLRWLYEHKCAFLGEQSGTLPSNYRCKECDFEGSKHELMSHMSKVHVKKLNVFQRRTYICDVCSAEYMTPQGFKNHLKHHQKPKEDKSELTCILCQQTFSTAGYLKLHNKRMHGLIDLEDSQHMCHLCSKSFARIRTLKRHVETVHSQNAEKKNQEEKENELKCYNKTCSKTFKKDWLLQEHYVTIHEKKTPHPCPDCDKKFGLYSTMMKHKNQAHGSLKCDECNKDNFNSYRLGQHKRKYHQKS